LRRDPLFERCLADLPVQCTCLADMHNACTWENASATNAQDCTCVFSYTCEFSGRALLAGQWKERKEDTVRLDGIDRHSFRLLLDYIYSGEVRVGGLEELLNVLVSGEHVGLHGLRDLCVHRLQQRLDLPNSLQMRLFAAEISCPELEEAASEIILGDFAQVRPLSNILSNIQDIKTCAVRRSYFFLKACGPDAIFPRARLRKYNIISHNTVLKGISIDLRISKSSTFPTD